MILQSLENIHSGPSGFRDFSEKYQEYIIFWWVIGEREPRDHSQMLPVIADTIGYALEYECKLLALKSPLTYVIKHGEKTRRLLYWLALYYPCYERKISLLSPSCEQRSLQQESVCKTYWCNKAHMLQGTINHIFIVFKLHFMRCNLYLNIQMWSVILRLVKSGALEEKSATIILLNKQAAKWMLMTYCHIHRSLRHLIFIRKASLSWW